MTDVGQALRQDIADKGNILSDSIMRQGALTDAFGAIVRESTLLNDSKYDMYDLEDNYGSKITGDIDGFLERFERAEYSLGHVLDHSDAIDKAFLEDTSNVISISDHHNFQYSLKNTASEQDSASLSGDKVDDNVSSDIFRQKIGIVDPEAESKKARIRAQRDMIALAIQDDQQKLMIEIRELQKKIKLIDEDLKDINEAQQALIEGELNEDTEVGSARRRKVEQALSKQGKSLNDFKMENGLIDQDAVKQHLQEHEDRLTVEKNKLSDDINEKMILLDDRRRQEFETAIASNDAQKIDELSRDVSASDIMIQETTQGDIDLAFGDADLSDMKSMMFGSQQNQNIASDHPSTFETVDVSSGFESFDFNESDDTFIAENNGEQSVAEFESFSPVETLPSFSASSPVSQDRSLGSFAFGEDHDQEPLFNAPQISEAFMVASSAQPSTMPSQPEAEPLQQQPYETEPTVKTMAI